MPPFLRSLWDQRRSSWTAREFTIGNGLGMGLCFKNDSTLGPDGKQLLDAEHAVISRTENAWILTNRSRSGVYVNDIKTHQHKLEDGDRISFGGDSRLSVGAKYRQPNPKFEYIFSSMEDDDTATLDEGLQVDDDDSATQVDAMGGFHGNDDDSATLVEGLHVDDDSSATLVEDGLFGQAEDDNSSTQCDMSAIGEEEDLSAETVIGQMASHFEAAKEQSPPAKPAAKTSPVKSGGMFASLGKSLMAAGSLLGGLGGGQRKVRRRRNVAQETEEDKLLREERERLKKEREEAEQKAQLDAEAKQKAEAERLAKKEREAVAAALREKEDREELERKRQAKVAREAEREKLKKAASTDYIAKISAQVGNKRSREVEKEEEEEQAKPETKRQPKRRRVAKKIESEDEEEEEEEELPEASDLTLQEARSLTVTRLKDELLARTLSTSGRKAELQSRLIDALSAASGSPADEEQTAGSEAPAAEQEEEEQEEEEEEKLDVSSMTVVQLKEELQSRGLDSRGRKNVLQARLKRALSA